MTAVVACLPWYLSEWVRYYYDKSKPLTDLSDFSQSKLCHWSVNCFPLYQSFILSGNVNCWIGIDGVLGLVFGTSASAPVVASMITLINDARIASGKGPVGFINHIVLLFPASCPYCNSKPFWSLAVLPYICTGIQWHHHGRQPRMRYVSIYFK